MSYKLKICPICSTENLGSEKKCSKCKASIRNIEAVIAGEMLGTPSNTELNTEQTGKTKKTVGLGASFIISIVLAVLFLWLCTFFLRSQSGSTSTEAAYTVGQGNMTRIVYIFGLLTAGYWLFTNKTRKYRKSAVIMGVYWIIGTGIVVMVNTGPSSSSPIASPVPVAVQTYPIPLEVQPIVTELGIDSNIINKVAISIPADNSGCKSIVLAEPAACFSSTPPRITFPVAQLKTAKNVRDATFAHEYLHYIWSTMTQTDKDQLTPFIEQVYQNSKPYTDIRIKNYNFTAEGKDSRVNELHSYIGTEIADSIIPTALLNHYKQYLPNRNALPSFYPYPVIQRYQPPVYIPQLYIPPVYVPPAKVCRDYGITTYDYYTHQSTHIPNVMCF